MFNYVKIHRYNCRLHSINNYIQKGSESIIQTFRYIIVQRFYTTVQRFWWHYSNIFLIALWKSTGGNIQRFWLHYSNILIALFKDSDCTIQRFWLHYSKIMIAHFKDYDCIFQRLWKHSSKILESIIQRYIQN